MTRVPTHYLPTGATRHACGIPFSAAAVVVRGDPAAALADVSCGNCLAAIRLALSGPARRRRGRKGTCRHRWSDASGYLRCARCGEPFIIDPEQV